MTDAWVTTSRMLNHNQRKYYLDRHCVILARVRSLWCAVWHRGWGDGCSGHRCMHQSWSLSLIERRSTTMSASSYLIISALCVHCAEHSILLERRAFAPVRSGAIGPFPLDAGRRTRCWRVRHILARYRAHEGTTNCTTSWEINFVSNR